MMPRSVRRLLRLIAAMRWFRVDLDWYDEMRVIEAETRRLRMQDASLRLIAFPDERAR